MQALAVVQAASFAAGDGGAGEIADPLGEAGEGVEEAGFAGVGVAGHGQGEGVVGDVNLVGGDGDLGHGQDSNKTRTCRASVRRRERW